MHGLANAMHKGRKKTGELTLLRIFNSLMILPAGIALSVTIQMLICIIGGRGNFSYLAILMWQKYSFLVAVIRSIIIPVAVVCMHA